MQKKFITVGGDSLCYVDEGSGPPLLLVHGYLVSHAVWKHIMPELTKHFRVIAPDLLGHGDSAKPAVDSCRYDADTQATRLAQVLDALNIEKAPVVGHSMGGKVATHLAAQHPHKVTRLMLIDSAGMPQPLPFLGKLVQAPIIGPFLFMKGYRRPVVKAYFKNDVFSHPRFVTDEMVDEVYRCLNLPNARAALYAIMRNTVVPEARFVEMARALKIPVHMLWGALDRIYPVAVAQQFQQTVPGATLKVLQGVAHSPPEEDPATTAAEIAQFARGGAAETAQSAVG